LAGCHDLTGIGGHFHDRPVGIGLEHGILKFISGAAGFRLCRLEAGDAGSGRRQGAFILLCGNRLCWEQFRVALRIRYGALLFGAGGINGLLRGVAC
jgi:hypothetical protein